MIDRKLKTDANKYYSKDAIATLISDYETHHEKLYRDTNRSYFSTWNIDGKDVPSNIKISIGDEVMIFATSFLSDSKDKIVGHLFIFDITSIPRKILWDNISNGMELSEEFLKTLSFRKKDPALYLLYPEYRMEPQYKLGSKFYSKPEYEIKIKKESLRNKLERL